MHAQPLEHIAKAAVLADPEDLPALAAMHQMLLDALKGPTTAGTVTHNHLQRAAELVERVVLNQEADAEHSLNTIRELVQLAQSSASAASSVTAALSPDRAIDSELLSAWLLDCTDTLADLESAVLAADSSEEDRQPAREAVRRTLHTLKGECGVIPLPEAQRLFHTAESATQEWEKATGTFPTDGLLTLLDWMRGYVQALRSEPTAPPPNTERVIESFGLSAAPSRSQRPSGQVQKAALSFTLDASCAETLPDFLAEAREHLASAEQALIQLDADPRAPEPINTIFRAFHTIKGVAGFMNLDPIVQLAHHGECLLDAARSGRLELQTHHRDLIIRTSDTLGQLLSSLEGNALPDSAAFSALLEQLSRADREVAAEQSPVDDLTLKSAGQCNALPATPVRVGVEAPPCGTPAPTPQTSAAPASRPGHSTPPPTVKVTTSRLDTLVDMIGELVIAQQMVAQDPAITSLADRRLRGNLAMMSKIVRDLQEVSMSLRMVPVRATFQKMARLVRDVATKAGKSVILTTEGEDVELDRNIVEAIADPLVHMIRNAADHGIEPPEVRAAAGKPRQGTISLRAYHAGGSIVIEIQDDGKGLDRRRILAKASAQGLLPPDRTHEQYTDQEVFDLIFMPGFSTADKVTDISGRGVGMDVVKRNIQSLRGRIDIRSSPGEGSTFALRLPLTMAIIDGMVVRAGNQRLVIPTLSVEHSFRAGSGQFFTVTGRGQVASVRGNLVPVHHLEGATGLGPARAAQPGDLVVVVDAPTGPACLIVDQIVGQQQIVIKPLGLHSGPVRGIAGGAILGDGKVALILDMATLLSQADSPNEQTSTLP